MPVSPDILLVLATVVGVFSFASVMGGWAAREMPWLAAISLAIAVGLMVYLHLSVVPGGLTWRSVPDAFISIAARLLNPAG